MILYMDSAILTFEYNGFNKINTKIDLILYNDFIRLFNFITCTINSGIKATKHILGVFGLLMFKISLLSYRG